jgi:ubiquinone/menaquinone biosynthesis C-methylase UbiE
MPLTPVVEKKVVASDLRHVYDRIAAEWYGLRHHSRFSPELQELAQSWKGGLLLNIGCGHGADFLPFRDSFQLHGVDFSPKMIEMAGKYILKNGLDVELAVADAGRLPYANDSFDWAIAVALYHHIEGGQARLAALRELKRVLAPGGEAFITVWNR